MSSLSAQFKAPKSNSSKTSSKLFGLTPDVPNAKPSTPPSTQDYDNLLEAIQEVETEKESSDSSSDDEFNSTTTAILADKADEFLSEYGESLFKLTVKQWLNQQQKKNSGVKRAANGSLKSPPAKKVKF